MCQGFLPPASAIKVIESVLSVSAPVWVCESSINYWYCTVHSKQKLGRSWSNGYILLMHGDQLRPTFWLTLTNFLFWVYGTQEVVWDAGGAPMQRCFHFIYHNTPYSLYASHTLPWLLVPVQTGNCHCLCLKTNSSCFPATRLHIPRAIETSEDPILSWNGLSILA